MPSARRCRVVLAWAACTGAIVPPAAGLPTTVHVMPLPQVSAPGELRPDIYREATLFTLRAGCVWPDALAAVGGDEVLISQGLAPRGQRYERLHASGRLAILAD
jgi:hypothetical protein